MDFRLRLLSAAGLVLAGSACAASSGGGGSSGSSSTPAGAAAAAPAPPPEARVLAQGVPPKENMWTRSATLYLGQAQRNAIPTDRRARFEEALANARDGIRNDPGNPKSYFQAGQAYIGLNDLAGADSMFTTAENIYPRYYIDIDPIRNQKWALHYNQGIQQLQTDEAESAVEAFMRANLIFRGRPEAMLNLGSAFSATGDIERSIEYYQMSIDVIRGPKFAEQSVEAQDVWRSNEQVAVFNMAQLLGQVERFDEAISAYEDYLESDPENVTATSNLAIILMRAGQDSAAVTLFQGMLERTDLNARDYFMAGIGLYQSNAFEMAAQAFSLAVELTPASRDAVYNLAQSYYQLEAWDDLLPVAEELVVLDPNNANGYLILAQAMVRDGDDQEAVRILEAGQALPFEVLSTQMQTTSGGGGIIGGRLVNHTLDEGATVVIEFFFVGMDGEDVGMGTVEVTAGAVDAEVQFQTEFTSASDAVGYRYQIASP